MLPYTSIFILLILSLLSVTATPKPDISASADILNTSSQNPAEAVQRSVKFATDSLSKNITWLNWINQTSLPTFTDLNSDSGQNYQSCGAGKVMVGIQCTNTNCNTLTLYCGTLSSISGDIVNIDMSEIPSVGDSAAISKYANYFNDASIPPYRVCPDGSFGNGVACTGSDCKSQSLYCGSVLQPNYSEQVLFVAPTSDAAMNLSSRLSVSYCSWENTATIGGPPAICPRNKVVSGLYATGKRSSNLKVLCCPIYQMNPVDCQYSNWTTSGECIYAVNNCGIGIQRLARAATQKPLYLGKQCTENVDSIQPCYTECSAQVAPETIPTRNLTMRNITSVSNPSSENDINAAFN